MLVIQKASRNGSGDPEGDGKVMDEEVVLSRFEVIGKQTNTEGTVAGEDKFYQKNGLHVGPTMKEIQRVKNKGMAVLNTDESNVDARRLLTAREVYML